MTSRPSFAALRQGQGAVFDLRHWQQALSSLRARDASGKHLQQVETVLMVFEDRLYHCGSGSWRRIDRLDSALRPDPEALAAAARELLDGMFPEGGLLLLLPGQEFVATTVALPGVAREAIKPALRLQADTLLPGCDEPLALAINPGRQTDALEETALWMPEARLDALFEALADRGLFLAAVMPRVVAAAAGQAAAQLEDNDSHTITRIQWENRALVYWQQISRQDLQEELFREQWQRAEEKARRPDLPQLQISDGEQYIRQAPDVGTAPEYCFFPAGAMRAWLQQQQQRRTRMLASAAAIAVFLGLMPFLVQTFDAWRLTASLERHHALAAEARSDQAAVRDFEADWGIFTEYPRQRLDEALFTLQEVISPNVLTSFEMTEGRIQIEGESQDPQGLLQALEAHPLFTQVDFARATSNNRYAIELRLTTMDFPSYYSWYFPEQRQR